MTLLDLAKKYPSMRMILLRNRRRQLKKEMALLQSAVEPLAKGSSSFYQTGA